MSSKLSEEFRIKIKSKIDEIENKTSLEFLPVLAPRSSRYLFFRSLVVLSFVLLWFVWLEYFYPLQIFVNIGISVGIGVVIALALQIPFVLRHALPHRTKMHEVFEAAHKVFLQEEVFATKDRTGVLIFISEFEKAVYVLADKGLSSKVPAEKWAELGRKLAKDFQHQTAGDTFMEALDELAREIAPAFPPTGPARHELSDEVRTL